MKHKNSNIIKVSILLVIILITLTSCTQSNLNKNQNEQDNMIDINMDILEPHTAEARNMWEELIDGYTQINPHVQINLQFVTADKSAWRSRITTALMAATAPDIIQTEYVWAQADYRDGLVADLSPYYEYFNPYDHGVKWAEAFPDRVINQLTDPTTGSVSAVSVYASKIEVVYNKEYFAMQELKVPQNWDQFMAIQNVMKRDGIIPFAFANDKLAETNFSWIANELLNQNAPEKVKAFDLNHDGLLQLNEIVSAVDQGEIDFTQVEWHSFMSFIKAWSEFWPEDYNVLDANSALEMFVEGKAAMMLVDNNHLKMISKSKDRKFDYGTFSIPMLFETEQFLPNWVLDGVLSIPKGIQEERFQTAVDLLMYLTSSEAIQKLQGEHYKPIRLLDEAEVGSSNNSDMTIAIPLFNPMMDKKLYETLNQIGQIYLDGTIRLEDYMKELNDALYEAVERMMKENDWHESNDYGMINSLQDYAE